MNDSMEKQQKEIIFNFKSNKHKINKFSIHQLKLQPNSQLKLKDFSRNISHVSPFHKSLSLKNWNKGNKILPALNIMYSHRQKSPKKQGLHLSELTKSQTIFKTKTKMTRQSPQQVLFYYQNLNQNVDLKNNAWQIENSRQQKNNFKSKQVSSKTVYKWKEVEKRNIQIKGKQDFYQKKLQLCPNQLITRKLEWEGKQTKKVDRNQIHLKLLKQIQSNKLIKTTLLNGSWLKNKDIFDVKQLNGWEQNEKEWQNQ